MLVITSTASEQLLMSGAKKTNVKEKQKLGIMVFIKLIYIL